MPHNVQSMMYCGEVPWHGLGTPLDRPATAQEAIHAAELDWEVTKQRLFAGGAVPVKDRFAIIRKDLFEKGEGPVFGIVGSAYTPLQNRDAFRFFDPIVGENAAIYHTAGALGSGERIWILAKLPDNIQVVKDDITEKYLLLSNSHDGMSAVQIKFTPIRVVCQNTLTMALNYGRTLRITHFPDIHRRLEQAHQILGIIRTTYSTIEESFKAMAKVMMDESRLQTYFKDVLPDPRNKEDEKAIKRVNEWRGEFRRLFEEGLGSKEKDVHGTLWAAYNGVAEFVDYRPTQSNPSNRLKRIWFGQGAAVKVRAFQMAENRMRMWAN